MNQTLALVDCNSFYCSCEQVFRPDLNGRPVVVLSNNDGCIIARNAEAKELGIEMGEPLFQIRDKLAKERVAIFSSNYTLYGDMSRRVMEVLGQFSPDVEIYSIDESFLRLPDPASDPLEVGNRIRHLVKKWTGIPVSVGIAPTKTLAKLANRIAKKRRESQGVHRLGTHDAILDSTDVADVWGIGNASARKLKNAGIFTVAKLRDAEDAWVLKQLSIVGLKLVHELRGDSCLPLTMVSDPKKGICVSRSFGRPITTLTEMKQAVALFTSRSAEKLRRQHSLAVAMGVFFETNRFNDDPQCQRFGSFSLPVPSSATTELVRLTAVATEQLFRDGFRYKKAGVLVHEIVSDAARQTNLFYRPDTARDDRVSAVMDRINREFGRQTIHTAAEGIHPEWSTRFEFRSPRYTTRWDELPEAG